MNKYTSYSIYRIVCAFTGKVYVGQSSNPARRRNDHFNKLSKNTHINKHLQSAYNFYGESAFYFEIIETNISPDKVAEREQYWIAHFDCCTHGFNATPGGDFEPSKRGKRTGYVITWNGIEYPSVSEAARANNIGNSAMRKRLKNGYTCDNDVPLSKQMGNSCTWNGMHYNTVREAALACGIDENSMHQRLGRGYVCNDDMPGRSAIEKPCIWNGVYYPSLKKAAIATGILHSRLCKYIHRGYTCDADINNRRYKP
jgi:GIY-YIG catalytic domain-containing protein